MKILTYLIAVYIIILSVIPCKDIESVSNVGMQQIEASHTKENSSHKDFCSPLCSCNCCQITISSIVFPQIITTPKLIEVFSSEKIQLRKDFFQNKLYADIWQPPKILIAG
ncbi:hypothetical protein HX001_04115 [Empedobacter brevis]|uniref:Uncharacterized protein n=1 Tax=Empedobacter brevis TaxID=247 RepID=A0AAJ1V6I7_9FLAO|nr:DUF6660 family protein [Empedobacter brevis]MDM1071676.1 hypothetical protein [Empedobacter brevis]QES94062.1 hypothetical protein F0358_15735 [Empedobacter brevis]QHC85884.1 hypothetical protein AS589_14375 [Empedobacter brevis]